jgi:hypothetical protein
MAARSSVDLAKLLALRDRVHKFLSGGVILGQAANSLVIYFMGSQKLIKEVKIATFRSY